MEHVINLRIQFKKAVEDFQEAAETATSATDKVTKAAYQNKEAWGDVRESWQEALKQFDVTHPIDSLRRIAKAVNHTVPALKYMTAVLWPLKAALSSTIGLQGQMVQTLNQVSDASTNAANSMERLTMGERVTDSLHSIHNAALASLSSLQETAQVYSSLAMQRVEPTSLEALTEVALKASKALGASTDQMADLTGHLSRVGDFSAENVGTMAQEFAHVQDMVGLTNDELSNVIELTKQITTQLSAFGASAESITEVSSAAARTTAMFKELGFGAQRGGEIINQIFDPSRLQENAFMINRMGMGMKNYMDIMHGGRVEQEQLTEGLVRAAQDIEQMREQGAHFMALEARAQRMGFNNAREALQLAQKGPDILEKMNSEAYEQQQELQKQAAEGMSELNRIGKTLKNTFFAVFGDVFSGLLGDLTNAMEGFNQTMMENMPKIKDALSSFFQTAIEYISGIDWQNLFDRITNFFSNIGDWISNAVEWMGNLGDKLESLITWGKRAVIALGGLWILSKLAPILKSSVGLFSGLASKLQGIGGAAGKAAPNLQAMKGAALGGLGAFLQMAGVAAIIASIAWSIHRLALAGQLFQEVDWSSMAKMGAAIGGLVAAASGLAAVATAMANPATLLGLTALSGAMLAIANSVKMMGQSVKMMGEGFEDFDEHIGGFTENLAKLKNMTGEVKSAFETIEPVVKGFANALQRPLESVAPNLDKMAGAIMEVTKAANQLNPDKLSELGNAIKQDDVAGFARLGDAMSQMVGSLNIMREGDLKEKAESVSILSKALKQLSLAVWVLGESENVKESIAGIGELVTSVLDAFKGGFTVIIGNVKGIGEAFAEMSKGIERVSKLDVTGLGDDLKQISGGIEAVINAMSSANVGRGGRGGAGGGNQFIELGKGFKQMAIGIWALGESNLKNIADNVGELVDPVNSMIETLAGNKGYVEGIEATSKSFREVTESIASFADIKANKLENIANMLQKSKETISDWIKSIGEAGANRYNDLKNVGQAFEIVANSLGKLAAVPNLEGLGDRLKGINSAISSVLGGLAENTEKTGGLAALFTGEADLTKTADSLYTLSEALMNFSQLSGISGVMAGVASGIDEITASLKRYDEMLRQAEGDVAAKFSQFVSHINQAGPIQVQTEEVGRNRNTMTEEGTTDRGATRTGTLASSIQLAFRTEVDRLIQAVERVDASAQARHEEKSATLDQIRKHVKMRTR